MAKSDSAGLSFGSNEDTLFVTDPMSLAMINTTTGHKQWTMYDPNGNSISPTLKGFSSSPLVVNGITYVTTYSGYMYGITTSGSIKYSYHFPNGDFSSSSPSWCPPIGIDGLIIIPMSDIVTSTNAKGTVWAFNPNLTVKWMVTLGNGLVSYRSTVTISSSTIYIPMLNIITKTSSLYAINAYDGSVAWSSPFTISKTNSLALGAPSVSHDDDTIYWTALEDVYAISASTGRLLWVFNLVTVRRSDESLYGITTLVDATGTLYVGSYDTCTLYALVDEGSRASIKWEYSVNGYTGARVNNVPNVKGCFVNSIIMGTSGMLLAADGYGNVYAFGPGHDYRDTPTTTNGNNVTYNLYKNRQDYVVAYSGDGESLFVATTHSDKGTIIIITTTTTTTIIIIIIIITIDIIDIFNITIIINIINIINIVIIIIIIIIIIITIITIIITSIIIIIIRSSRPVQDRPPEQDPPNDR